MSEFNVKTEVVAGVPVIRVVGEVDVYTAPVFKKAIAEQLSNGCVNIAVNLTGTEYIDATGLGVTIGGLKRTREHGGGLSIICPTGNIRRIFEITGLDKVFKIFGTRDEALEALTMTSRLV